MSALTEPDRERLVKLLGLLGSSFAGERDAAGQAAVRLLRERGLQWSDVIAAPNCQTSDNFHPSDWRDDVETAIHNFSQLTPWEQSFVVSLRGYRRRLSPKQSALLREIARKVHAAEGNSA